MVLVIIPTYNEVRNIGAAIQRLQALSLGLSVLVVDDNSSDGTADEVNKLAVRSGRIMLMSRPRKMGLGSAYRDGFRYALEHGYDIMVQMDADLSHPVEALPAMVALLKENDLVIGSRYVPGGGIVAWPWFRFTLSRLANAVTKRLLRLPVDDATSGFKCMRKSVLEQIDVSTIGADGYAFQIEMAFRAVSRHIRVIEYPIVFQGRAHERSKMSLGIIIEAFVRVAGLAMSQKR